MVMFGIENQTSYDKDMPIRVMSYDAAQYRRQLDSKERYPVATLIIYYGEKKWENRTLFENIQVPEDMQSFVSDYRINVYDLSNLTDEEIDRFQSDFGIIADYLKHSREDPGYIPTKKIEYKHPHETLDLLSRFTGDEKYRQIFRQERGEVIDMRSPLDYWLEKGREEGREEGIEVGEKQALLQSLKTIMETLNLTKDQAMDVLKVPETEREYYLSHI